MLYIVYLLSMIYKRIAVLYCFCVYVYFIIFMSLSSFTFKISNFNIIKLGRRYSLPLQFISCVHNGGISSTMGWKLIFGSGAKYCPLLHENTHTAHQQVYSVSVVLYFTGG